MSQFNLEDIKTIVRKEQERKSKDPGMMELLAPFGRHYENPNSDIIAYLLDPKAAHNHKDEYLKLFLETVGGDFRSLVESSNLQEAQVYRESAADGRIDILIKIDNKFIILENKIDAFDQKFQLWRYYNYLIKQGISAKDIYMLYLTYFGEPPSIQSLEGDGEKGEKIDTQHRYKNISYDTIIIEWLDQIYETLNYNKDTLLKSAIEQYRYSVKTLTNQIDTGAYMQKELLEKISSWDSSSLEEMVECSKLLSSMFHVLKCLQVKNKLKDLLIDQSIYFFLNDELIEGKDLNNKIQANSSLKVGIKLENEIYQVYHYLHNGDEQIIRMNAGKLENVEHCQGESPDKIAQRLISFKTI